MALLDLLMPKTKVPEPKTTIEGKVLRFGLWRANEFNNHFAFLLDGYDEMFSISLSAIHDVVGLALVGPGDTLTANGVMKEGYIKDCVIAVNAGGRKFRFRTDLTIHG